VLSGLIEQLDGMLARRYLLGDFDQVQVHRPLVAPRQNQTGAFALLGADGAEDIGRGGYPVIPRLATVVAESDWE
jgi:hypothetical protein